MKNVFENAESLIGNTPMLKLKKISRDIPGEVWAKLEFHNPSGSVKDRIALGMIEEAERKGLISKGATVVEPTSGNTGIGFSLVCALKGYKMIAVMPEAMSIERRKIMQYLGARVEIFPSSCGDPSKGFTKEDLEGTLERARQLVKEIPNSFMPNQFENPDNPFVHGETTAAEILEQTGGKFDAYVAACGTGGTFTGVAEILKEKHPGIKRVVVEPASSAVIAGNPPGFHKIEGIGEGFIPKNMCTELADVVFPVEDDVAMDYARRLAREEGLLCGISSGANVFASLEIGKDMGEDSVIVTLIPDNAYRYFSTDLFR